MGRYGNGQVNFPVKEEKGGKEESEMANGRRLEDRGNNKALELRI